MPNPYISQQAQAIQTDANNNLQRNILPGINSGAVAAGGFGGSRHGIAQANAISQTQQGVAGQQANLYANAYNTDQNIQSQQSMQQAQLAAQQRIAEMQNGTQRYGMDQSYGLGMGQLGLGYQNSNNQFSLGQQQNQNQATANQNQFQLGQGSLQNQRYGMDQNYGLGLGQLGLNSQTANQNFYSTQRGQDLQQLSLGAQLAGQGNNGLANQGQQLYNIGQTQQNAPWLNLQNYGNALAPFSGLNQSNNTTTPGGSTLGNIAGGALTAAQLWKLLSGG
jgi:hypothetical protein